MHIQDREQCNWLRAKIETERKKQYSPSANKLFWTGWRGANFLKTFIKQV